MYKRQFSYEHKWLKGEMQRLTFKRMIAMYNKLRLQEGRNALSLSMLKILVQAWRPNAFRNEGEGVKKLKSMLQLTEVKNYADAMLMEAMKLNGVDHKWLIEKRKEVVAKGFTLGKLDSVNNALDVLEGYAGMKNTIESKKTEETQPIDYGKLDSEIQATQELPEHQEATLIPELLEKEKVEVSKSDTI